MKVVVVRYYLRKFGALMAAALPLVLAAPAAAAGFDICPAGASGKVCGTSSGSLIGGGDSIFANIISTLIFVIGAVAVIVIIVGGIQYVTAAGDENKTKSAKNTILYAVVGLVLAVAAYGIVSFVLSKLA